MLPCWRSKSFYQALLTFSAMRQGAHPVSSSSFQPAYQLTKQDEDMDEVKGSIIMDATTIDVATLAPPPPPPSPPRWRCCCLPKHPWSRIVCVICTLFIIMMIVLIAFLIKLVVDINNDPKIHATISLIEEHYNASTASAFSWPPYEFGDHRFVVQVSKGDPLWYGYFRVALPWRLSSTINVTFPPKVFVASTENSTSPLDAIVARANSSFGIIWFALPTLTTIPSPSSYYIYILPHNTSLDDAATTRWEAHYTSYVPPFWDVPNGCLAAFNLSEVVVVSPCNDSAVSIPSQEPLVRFEARTPYTAFQLLDLAATPLEVQAVNAASEQQQLLVYADPSPTKRSIRHLGSETEVSTDFPAAWVPPRRPLQDGLDPKIDLVVSSFRGSEDAIVEFEVAVWSTTKLLPRLSFNMTTDLISADNQDPVYRIASSRVVVFSQPPEIITPSDQHVLRRFGVAVFVPHKTPPGTYHGVAKVATKDLAISLSVTAH